MQEMFDPEFLTHMNNELKVFETSTFFTKNPGIYQTPFSRSRLLRRNAKR